MPRRKLWPVTFRPKNGEVLYSWIARIVAVYGISPSDLLPDAFGFQYPSSLVQSGDQRVLRTLAQSTGVSVKALTKRTVAGSSSRWPQDWWAGGTLPSSQICPMCLADDLKSGDRVQFLRLRWQCAAMTICPKHLVPLLEACSQCRQIKWPICETTGFGRFRFVCDQCGSPQETTRPIPNASEPALRLLLAFETQLIRALQGCSIQWSWIGHATPAEFLLLVKDLLWAITCPTAMSKPIYQLQTSCFPLGYRCLPLPASMHWGLGSPNVRRCLLAAVLAVFGNSRIRSLLEACPEKSGWSQLLSRVSANNIEDLQRRSWHWPPAAHNSLRRAIESRFNPQRQTHRARALISYDVGKITHRL